MEINEERAKLGTKYMQMLGSVNTKLGNVNAELARIQQRGQIPNVMNPFSVNSENEHLQNAQQDAVAQEARTRARIMQYTLFWMSDVSDVDAFDYALNDINNEGWHHAARMVIRQNMNNVREHAAGLGIEGRCVLVNDQNQQVQP